MIEIKQVETKKQQKEFLNFPIKLYKGNPYFVPPLFIDEKKIFRKDYVYNDTCDVVFYNAYKDGKMVGRISGIIQRSSNEKWNQNRVRFTRFDSINDQNVSDALFDAVEKWAKAKNITEIVGPLGYSDLEREGLLIEGFDQLSTYEEQYNYDYYQALIENYGFKKEVDWLEHKLYPPKQKNEKLARLSAMMLEKYKLKLVIAKSIKQYVKEYVDQFFEILDTTYVNIYGTVPFTEGMKKMMISNFKMLTRAKDLGLIVDENNKVVGFALGFPSISKAVQKSNGRITIPFLFRFLKAKRHPKIFDLGLIGIIPQYESKGIATALIAGLLDLIEKEKFEYMETNLTLEENMHIINMFKHFEKVYHKRRRSYVKQI